MQEKNIYGQISAEQFDLGDIVEWKRWNEKTSEWDIHYGVITDIKTKLMSNRLVCISTVLPIEGNQKEKDLNLYLKDFIFQPLLDKREK